MLLRLGHDLLHDLCLAFLPLWLIRSRVAIHIAILIVSPPLLLQEAIFAVT